MSRIYDDPDRETDFERDERRLALEEDRRDRLSEKGSVPSDTLPGTERFIDDADRIAQSHGWVPITERDVLPRDIEDHPAAQARIERLADDYASVEVDRLPPMGALHWLVTGHKADGSADTFRVGAHGSLMPWPVKP